MSLVESNMMALDSPAPDFALRDTTGEIVRIGDFDDAPVLVVAFICNHCPFVKHIRNELATFGRELVDRGGAMVAINANDPATVPADGPEEMIVERTRAGYVFPYLFDADQSVARAYGAVCTPDFFVFDADRRLVYRGRFDGSRPNSGTPVTGEDLRDAVDAVLKGQQPDSEQHPSIGCSIKWR